MARQFSEKDKGIIRTIALTEISHHDVEHNRGGYNYSDT